MVTGEEMRQIDRYAIEEIGLKEELLMENAGQAFVNEITSLLDKKTAKIAVLIGAGNNGGDGFVISRSLLEKGYHVDVWLIPPLEKVKGAARYHMDVYLKSGFGLISYHTIANEGFMQQLTNYSHVIDALLGTGFKGTLRSPYKEIIEQVNKSNCSVFTVDLPSGITADGTDVETLMAIKASHTISFQCPKLSSFIYPPREFYGNLSIVDIGIPKLAVIKVSSKRHLWTEEDVTRTLPVRRPSSHKGSHGKGLIIAGSKSMTGAPILTTRACHRLGAGLVTLATPCSAHPAIASQLIEATFHLCPSKNGEIDDLNISNDVLEKRYDAIAIGPGLGRNNNGFFIEALIKGYHKPLIIDADGLYYLKYFLPGLLVRKQVTILTPHLGEFAYLTNESIKMIEKNRFQLSKEFAEKYGVYLVLKGPYTIVTTPEGHQFINTTGNSSLAKGGTGDVLTGMVLALIMQQKDVQMAISNATFLHGRAADYLTENGWNSLSVVASDLVNVLPQVLDQLQNS
ncbi:NAD(P)H-hydrate dehydratase [Anaerobacillus isosaccharinicus]|uniref:NAD(P)H-hydrate dehydratase n=1 Tax=Anaerobacillus isosaccharinicus TaxID=1532552 RepID=A0A7S7LBE3_9BACI|nr:NAD(P)H-hydrate dehydratase [Anaerobacillus isosaccharinicus]